MSCLRGRVERVVHTSETFHILVVRVYECEDRSNVRETKVTGHFFGVSTLVSGAVLEFEGGWVRHPKYGLQFRSTLWRPWGRNASDVRYFLTNCVSIFGGDFGLLRRVVREFGTQSYDALGEVDRLVEVAASEDERRELRRVSKEWLDLRGVATLSDFLQEYELGASMVASVYQCFGAKAVEVLAENPYRLMEIEGFSFYRADKIAVAKGIGPDDPRRVVGGVLWTLREQIQQGHLYVQRGAVSGLMLKVASYSHVAPFSCPDLDSEVSKVLASLADAGSVKVDAGVGVYFPSTYLYERGAAEKLSQLLAPSELQVDLGAFLSNYEMFNNIELSKEQRRAVEQILMTRVLVVTGAPGTGKTTLVRSFVQLFRQLNVQHMLMAPTGIAAKRLTSVTGVGAQTIHRALRYDGFAWGHNRDCLLETQALIIDEFSMVDQELFYRLLDATPPTTIVIMVGDDAQLPSVGPGNVLRELLACEAVPHIRLEHVFRQAETSDIVLAAHRVRRGMSPLDIPEKEDSEFRFLATSDEDLIVDFVVQLAAKLKSRDENFQVVSPKYEGVVGVNYLNARLRDELNPDLGQPTWALPEFVTRIGDRLMVIKNNYNLNVYNGDIGKLVGITAENLILRIHGVGGVPDMEVEIPKTDAEHMLKLAYAVTVHRCQGEEFDTVIMPLVKTQRSMLQRNLFYTAITRARRKVWILGEVEAVFKAVSNDKVVHRNSILRDLVSCRAGA